MATGISLAVAIGVVGCGTAKQISAKQQVSDALAGFNKASSAEFTLSLDTSAADLEAIGKAEGDPISASDQAVFTKILAGDVVLDLEAADGKTFGDSTKADGSKSPDLSGLLNDPAALGAALKKSGNFATSVRLSGASLVDLRSVDGVIYAKADVKKILTLADQDPSQLDAQLESLPPALAPLAKAAKGQWVSIDLVKAAQAAKDKGLLKGLPSTAPSSAVDPAKVQKLIADLKAAYQQKATITELGDAGDKGDGYRLSAPAKQVAQAVSGDLIALVGKQFGTEVNKAIAQIPDKSFSLDLWVKDDKLTAVALDLTQFLDKPVPGKKLAVNIAINLGGGKVSAPSGATEIDVASLLAGLPAGLTSGLGGLSGVAPGGDPTSTGLTKAQIKMLKQSGMTDAQIKQLEEAQKQAKG